MNRILKIAGAFLAPWLCLPLEPGCASPHDAPFPGNGGVQYRELSLESYLDRMKAGWIGQMAGVGWGGPTEFKYQGTIIPQEEMPQWHPSMINQFHQDDLYVEMTFLRTLEVHGLDVSLRQAGIDWANSEYPLWHANRTGRFNLRSGIAPPDSGHPHFNSHADDIDYQIEADFSGLIAPGLPNTVIALGEKFGRLMNYGDGIYGGQFVGGMYAEAFFESDPFKIVEAGLRCIPEKSQYAEAIRDVLAGARKNPDNWVETWKRICNKYHLDPRYRRFSCSGSQSTFNIDAKLNGAFIAIGLLFGKGDLERTILISARCGQDSDCNPSNAGGVLFTTVGFSKLPDHFTCALKKEGEKFSHTPYSFSELVRACEKLARQAVLLSGGRIEKTAEGKEYFFIPLQKPEPGELEQSWDPGSVAHSRYTEEEMSLIRPVPPIFDALKKFAPSWKVACCGEEMDPGLRAEALGRKNVLVTHPLNRNVGCTLSRELEIPAGKKTLLHLVVGHHPSGNWTLVVKAAGTVLFEDPVGKETSKGGWRAVSVDLSPLAGRTVLLELINQPTGWAFEAAYWAEISLASE